MIFPPPARIGAASPGLIALRPEVEGATGARLLRMPAAVDAWAVLSARQTLRRAAKRIGRACLVVGPGPLDAPRTDPGQGPTSLVLAWDGGEAAPGAPDLARAGDALALMGSLGLATAGETAAWGRDLAGFSRRHLDEPTYFDAWRRRPIPFEEALRQVAWLRARHAENGRGFVLVGVSRWKRRGIASLLAGPGGPPEAARTAPAAVARAARGGQGVAAWVTRMPADLPDLCERAGVPLWRMEDGFLRSVGLGSSFRPGCSVVLDRRGIYFDPRRDSDLVHLLSTEVFAPELLARAALLRDAVTRLDVTKYNVGLAADALDLPAGRRVVLVCGQVEDDASVKAGASSVRTNLALLRAARRRNPGDFILFKAHPDVEAGFRVGAVPPEAVARHADRTADGYAMAALLQRVDHVETMTSLTGFEALLRGKTVACHGRPFYAGWGLTTQADDAFDRGRRLTLDQLVAGTLILYPRYLDPVTLRPCTPELAVERLVEARSAMAPSRLALTGIDHAALRWRHAVLGRLARRLREAGR